MRASHDKAVSARILQLQLQAVTKQFVRSKKKTFRQLRELSSYYRTVISNKPYFILQVQKCILKV